MNPGIRTILLISLCGFGLSCGNCFGQSSPQSSAPTGQAGSSEASPTAAPTTGSNSTATTDAKKKKVWTNEDVGDLNGPVSVVGNSKNAKGKSTAADGTADGQYIASTKKQLEKFQEQLNDTTKQIAALKDFQQGKAPEPAGYPLGKGYNRVPVDQQIASLEQKQKDLEQKISDLLDEARKKGVLPGQLR